MEEENLIEKKIDTREIYKGKILDLYVDTVELPNGNTAIREHLRHRGAACVVPLTAEGEVLMVRQYRYPMAEVTLEVPAGKLDTVGEDPLSAAKRELKEETGAEAEEIMYLGKYYPTCAYSNEVIHMYLAKDLTFGKADPDDDEFLEPIRIPLETLKDMVMRGEIPDGKTQAAVLKAAMLEQKTAKQK
ncbi:MAG: NUDIX hydrolase [Clostridia bacterium]|nr:NUDIX hydrolase [Clostridia bacterium]